MGTLMRKPVTATAAQTLPLPGRAPRTAVQSEPEVAPQVAAPSAAGAPIERSAAPQQTVADERLRQRAEQAEARCAQLEDSLAALRADLDDEKQAAREAGHADGVAEGRERVLADAAERAARLDALLAAMHERCTDALQANEDELVEAVMAGVGKMLGKRMATRRGAAAAVRQACRALDKRRELVLRVAPDDLEFLGADEGLVEHLGGKARFEADASVSLGGCVVEADGGTLDARLDTQLESLRRVLLRARDKRANEQARVPASAKPAGGKAG